MIKRQILSLALVLDEEFLLVSGPELVLSANVESNLLQLGLEQVLLSLSLQNFVPSSLEVMNQFTSFLSIFLKSWII